MEIDLSTYKDLEIYVGVVTGSDIDILKTYKVIKGDVYLARYNFSTFKDFTVEVVTGNFDCYECDNLKSLKGSPLIVGGDFDCSGCKSLKSLKGSSVKVEYFICRNCKNLITLQGAPKEIGRHFDCNGCESLSLLKSAESLKDCKINGTIYSKFDKLLNIAITTLKTPDEFISLGNVKVKLKLKKEED